MKNQLGHGSHNDIVKDKKCSYFGCLELDAGSLWHSKILVRLQTTRVEKIGWQGSDSALTAVWQIL